GCQMRSWSEDGGKTWTAPELTDLESPVSPATIERMPGSDELLLVWNDHENVAEELKGKRTPLNVAVVAADGKAILREYLLEDKPNGWYCYTAMQFVEDAVLLGYCAGEAPEIAHLSRTRIVRIPLEALGNGRP
ncbi:MAG: glycoside hydrolase, partial [Candidatus Hydrogenedentes bacterium]|nr:glycoside hydrolase [Candidatus Hydrogenedentota bacterium]